MIVNNGAIQNNAFKKPYLGGYRSKLTGVVYHHAKVQTYTRPWKYPPVEKCHRSIQTVDTKDKYQQTPQDSWTQVDVPKLFLSSKNDKILWATNQYVYADEINKKKLEAIITIQKNWRRWLARQEFLRRRQEMLDRILWDKEYYRLKAEEESKWLNELELRKKDPRTKEDFALVFSDLQQWLETKIEELKSHQSGPALKAAMCVLLDKHAERLRLISARRQEVQSSKEIENQFRFLTKAAASKVWRAYNEPIYVETEGTQKAKSLQDLYITISKPNLVPDDRISALRQLKTVIRPHGKSKLIKNILFLADREIDLLLRGIKDKMLQGLRARLRNLVWQFCRQPAYNPEAQRFSKLTQVNGEDPYILICSSCNQHYILPANTLDEATCCSVLQGRFTKCKSCKYLENEGWMRKDQEIYKRMIKLLKAEEEKQKTNSGIIYLLQPVDIAYMVEKIWQSQSCLSGSTVLKDLEFIRWNTQKNWTPWNCLLVTREEAVLHNRMVDFRNMYDKKFVRLVYLKHIKARRYFSSIPRFLPYLSLNYSLSDYDVACLGDSSSESD